MCCGIKEYLKLAALKHPRFNRHKSNHNWLTPNFVFPFSILHSQLANAPLRLDVVFLNLVIQRLAVYC